MDGEVAGPAPGSFEDKVARVEEQIGRPANEADIVFPDAEPFKIGDRTYQIKPLPLRKMKLLAKAQNINAADDSAWDQMAATVAEILGEPDVNFILDSLDIVTMAALFKTVQRVNYVGIPLPKGPAKKN